MKSEGQHCFSHNDGVQTRRSVFEYDFYTDSSTFSVLSGSPVLKSIYVSEIQLQ